MKIINIVDKDGGLVASIGEYDVILHDDYEMVVTEEKSSEQTFAVGELDKFGRPKSLT